MYLERLIHRATTAALLVCTITACYSRQSIGMDIPAPGVRIVAQLTDSGTVAMGNAIGPGATEVEGIVASADANAWTLNVLRVEQRGGLSSLWNRESVTFPRSALTAVSAKRINKKRSWLTAGIITVGAFVAARIFGAFDVNEGPGGGTPPPV